MGGGTYSKEGRLSNLAVILHLQYYVWYIVICAGAACGDS